MVWSSIHINTSLWYVVTLPKTFNGLAKIVRDAIIWMYRYSRKKLTGSNGLSTFQYQGSFCICAQSVSESVINALSHWLSAYTEWSPNLIQICWKKRLLNGQERRFNWLNIAEHWVFRQLNFLKASYIFQYFYRRKDGILFWRTSVKLSWLNILSNFV